MQCFAFEFVHVRSCHYYHGYCCKAASVQLRQMPTFLAEHTAWYQACFLATIKRNLMIAR